MIVSIHQPNYLPYLGFFHKIANSDVFVILDDSQYSKGDFHNRNRIKTQSGPKWLTIPVKAELKPIKDIKINREFKLSGSNWNDYHLLQIRENYRKSPHYDSLYPGIEEILKADENELIRVNLRIIDFLRNYFRIKTKTILSSTLNIKEKSTERLINIIRHLEGDTYLSGTGAKKYLDTSLFEKNKIKLIFQNFEHPQYRQQYEGFIPNLSAVDYCFNEGGELFAK